MSPKMKSIQGRASETLSNEAVTRSRNIGQVGNGKERTSFPLKTSACALKKLTLFDLEEVAAQRKNVSK